MKKMFFIVIALVAFSNVSMANTQSRIIAKDCGMLAATLLEIQEDFFGCLESDDYNFLYINIKTMCEQNMPISGLIR